MVLDSSALLAYLLAETGAQRVQEVLESGAMISTVNLAEVVSKLVDYGFPEESIAGILEDTNVIVVPFEQPTALESGLLRFQTRPAGLSLGDRSCLALAHSLGMVVLTGDRNWLRVDTGVAIELCR